MYSPTTSPYGCSSFQKEENGDRADFLVNLYPREREPRILIDQCRIFVTLIVESINPIINFKKMCAADERKRRDEKEERRACLSENKSTLL